MDILQKDPKFETYYSEASANSLKIGAYIYSYAENSAQAKKEAEVCLEWIRGKKFDLPVYIDMEEEKLIKLGKKQLTDNAITFCKLIKNSGINSGVYANANWFTNYLDYNKLKKNYSIWLAQYADAHIFDCDIWQYTDKGKISGENGFFDMNVIYSLPCDLVYFKKDTGLYRYPYIDTLGGTSIKCKTAKKGSAAQWIADDGFGWSKVKFDNKNYYAINGRISKIGLSSVPKIKLKKTIIAFKAKNIGLGKRTTIHKGKTIKVICTIEQGRFKGYRLIQYRGKDYYTP